LTYDPQTFPPLQAHATKATTAPKTQNATASTTTQDKATTTQVNQQENSKIDLDAIQKDIERSLCEDFQNLIHKELGPLRQEFHTTTMELQQQVDHMAKTVDLLHKQNTQILASLHQMTKPPLATTGAGQN